MGGVMKVTKIINNSFVLVENNKAEVIIMGKGIGFNQKVGDIIDSNKIEKTFFLKDKSIIYNHLQLIEETPYDYIQNINYIINYAKQELNEELNENIFVTLISHISYAITRFKNNIKIENKLLWEIKKFYPKEYCVGKFAVEYLNKNLNVFLGDDEAGNIAFHLVNAKSNNEKKEAAILSLKILKDIFNILQFNFCLKIDNLNLSDSKFLTYLELFTQRVLDNKMLVSKDDFIFEQMKKQYIKETKIINKISEYIEKTLSVKISSEEKLFLLIHIITIARENE